MKRFGSVRMWAAGMLIAGLLVCIMPVCAHAADAAIAVPAVSSTDNTEKGVLVKWNAVTGAEGYQLRRQNSDGTEKLFAVTTACSVQDNGKTNGGKYAYQVRAYRTRDGVRIWSEYSPLKVTYYLKAPSIDHITRTSTTQKVYWTKNAKCTGYQVQVASNAKFTNPKKATVSSRTTLHRTIRNLTGSKNAYARVRAYIKKDGITAYSDWSSRSCSIAWNTKREFASKSKIHSGYALWYESSVASSKRKNITVCVNAGHGTKNGESKKTLCHPDGSAKVCEGSTASGARYSTAVSYGTTMLDGTSEHKVTLALALRIKSALLKAGYNVLMIRESSDVQLDNVARTVIANKYAKAHISLHYDDTTSNVGAFVCSVPANRSYRSMYPVSKHYKQHAALGKSVLSGMELAGCRVRSENIEMDLTQTSYSTIPSIELEVGDRKSSHTKAVHDRIAKGIVKGLNSYFK